MQPVGARGVTLTPTVLVTMRRLADAMGIGPRQSGIAAWQATAAPR